MKEQIFSLYKILTIIVLVCIMQACGGSSDKTPAVTYSISASQSSINFSHEFLQASTDEIQIEVTFDGNGLLIGFAPNASPNAFIKYRTENVTATSATLYVSLNSTENLAPTTINTVLRLSTGDVDEVNLVHHDIDISVLIWQLSTEQTQLSFKGVFGDTTIAPQSLAITSEENNWQAEVDVDWLTLSVEEGTGDGTIVVTPILTNFTEAGLATANITLTEQTSGDSKVIPVELGLDNIYLFANQQAVSFVNSANSQTLTATIDVGTNFNGIIDWQASTTAHWLELTPNVHNTQLTISVDVNNLPNNSWSEASVVLSATSTAGVISSNLLVTLYNTVDEIVNQTIMTSINNDALVSSPTQPHIYVGSDNRLDIYHKYTHALLQSHVISPEDTLLEQFIMHPKGEHILAKATETITDSDGNVTEEVHRYRINLNDYSAQPLDNVTIEFEPLTYLSLAGRHFVITELLELADENLTQLFWDAENTFFTTTIDLATSANTIYALDLRDSSFNRFESVVNDYTSEPVSITATHQYRAALLPAENVVQSFVLDSTEQNMYAISPTSEWIEFDGEQFSDNGLLEQADDSATLQVLISANGNAHYIRFNPIEGFVIDSYDTEQTRVSTTVTSGAPPTQALLLQDNTQIILYSGTAQQLEFISL